MIYVGTLAARYIFGDGIDEVLSMRRAGQNYYYSQDGLNSISDIANVNGLVVESYAYDVYGTPSQTSQIGNRYMFTGREYDAETGLYYYRARYYSPQIGRFLQKDPITWTPSDARVSYQEDMVSDMTKNLIQARGIFNAQLLHNYSYVANSPINRVDPLGLSAEMIGRRQKLNWWLREAVVPGPFGQPMSEWRNGSPTEWGNAMEYTERAGGAWKWGERAAIGTAVVATAIAIGAGIGIIPNFSFRIGIDLAHHAFQNIGRVKHIQMDKWLKGVKGSDTNIFRIPLPWFK